METYCLYGVGIPTERSYIYKLSLSNRCKSIPFQIDSSANESGWRGRKRFNPSGIATYIREYRHKPPASFLAGRGLESGAHVDIMGNVALIEDVLRVDVGAIGVELGGEEIYSDIIRISEGINIRL
ncbi:putative phospholipid:diacylglycerol acyltransferase 2 [Camellia lanceoleosa]|uniref:Phospholipid:diacylglycerol acyltransferase 2 n=1 Tax=Camellia lanceoleosa TaxID=1840588 RepID=A0ACC0F2W1_9ERIC|nr:putative phospholipid:diacylglycerol acyltransferase 2 [Camellia lanceoleosa]